MAFMILARGSRASTVKSRASGDECIFGVCVFRLKTKTAPGSGEGDAKLLLQLIQ